MNAGILGGSKSLVDEFETMSEAEDGRSVVSNPLFTSPEATPSKLRRASLALRSRSSMKVIDCDVIECIDHGMSDYLK